MTWAGPAAAQAPVSEVRRAQAGAEVTLTRLAGAWVPQAGGTLSLRLAPWLRVGGVGRVGLDHPTVLDRGVRVRVRFGYGGLRVTVRPTPGRTTGLSLALLAGAGNVDVHGPSADEAVDSENGVVVEPALAFDRTLGGGLTLGVAFSWRLAFGFDPVGSVDDDSLSGPALTLGLGLAPF